MIMKLKVNKYEIEGKPEEILTFLLGYEMKEEFKNQANQEMKKQENINNLMNKLLGEE